MTTQTTIPSAPGVYSNVTFADYLRIDAWNHSTLSVGVKYTMQHVRHARDNRGDSPSDSMRIGSALHAWMLERERYGDIVVVSPAFDRRTKQGKADAAAFEAASVGKVVLDADEEATVKAMGAAIGMHPRARKLALTPGERECVVIWDDERSGLRCKARIDKLIRTAGIGVDIKTTRDASPDSFERSVLDYHYHTQVGFYADGWKAATGEELSFFILAVENDSPHGVAVYQIDDETMDIGRFEMRRVLAEVAACEKSGRWTGYADAVIPIGLPAWKKKQYALMLGGAE